MAVSANQIIRLTQALNEALEAQDWDQVKVLDEECRALVSSLSSDCASDLDLMAALQQLQTMYQKLIPLCQVERKQLAADLIQMNHTRQGIDRYRGVKS